MIKWMELDAGSMIPYEEHEILLNDEKRFEIPQIVAYFNETK